MICNLHYPHTSIIIQGYIFKGIRADMALLIVTSLTLNQWSSSGNPVAIQCAWNLDPSVHWNATGEKPVVFQWLSSGFPVCSNYAN